MTLLEQLEKAEAEAARIRREIAQAPCRERGFHRWKHIGGRACSCGHGGNYCSFPVYECEDCKDCDYGDNPEGAKIELDCLRIIGCNCEAPIPVNGLALKSNDCPVHGEVDPVLSEDITQGGDA